MSQEKVKETIESDRIRRVWIGDPCYVISEKLWDSVCEQSFPGNNVEGNVIEFTIQELGNAGMESVHADLPLKYLQCSTMYGDGEYSSYTGFDYGVDSGCLGIVPDYLIAPDKYGDAHKLGKFLAVNGSITLETDGNGEFIFTNNGKLIETITTAYEENEYYDEYEEHMEYEE